MLVHKDNLHAYTLFARTEERKREWIEAFADALDNVMPSLNNKTVHDMEMNTFEQPCSCAYCNKLLKGLFFQGYLCKSCNRPMHKGCIVYLTKCCGSQPPVLPPRPPSIQLPSPTTDNTRLSTSSVVSEQNGVNLSGTISLNGGTIPSTSPFSKDPPTSLIAGVVPSDADVIAALNSMELKSMPMPPSFTDLPPLSWLPSNTLDSDPDYVNIKMEEHPWYVGEMDRDGANTILKNYPIGTYLVRTRVQGGDIVGHAISLRTLEDSKHMKINCVDEGLNGSTTANTPVFSLSDSRKFKSIVELVSYFSINSLKESFSGLDTTLKFAYKDLCLVRANYDFSPDLPEPNLLPLKAGDILAVVGNIKGSTTGWLKAVKLNRIGYIPSDFVQPITEL